MCLLVDEDFIHKACACTADEQVCSTGNTSKTDLCLVLAVKNGLTMEKGTAYVDEDINLSDQYITC